MINASYFNASIAEFLVANDDEILGALTRRHGFSLEHQQKHAWQAQISILKEVLPADLEGQIFSSFLFREWASVRTLFLLSAA